MMDVRAVRDAEDYAWALGEIEHYFDAEPEPGTPESDRFDVLAVLIEAYEAKHHAVPRADPVELLHFAIDSLGRTQAELSRLLGSRARASEVLNRRRPLTLDMIRAIGAAWHLPIDALAQPYDLARASA